MSRLLPALLLALGLHLLLFQVMLPIREARPPVVFGRSQVTVSLARQAPSVPETGGSAQEAPPPKPGQAEREGSTTGAMPQAPPPATPATKPAPERGKQEPPVQIQRTDHISSAGQQSAAEGSAEAWTVDGVAAAGGVRESGGPALREAVPLAAENRPPEYPALARKRGWEGKVLLAVEVATDGTVGAARVQSGSGHDLLDETALQAVRAWRFQPGSRDGVPVAMQVLVPVHFLLKDGP